MDCEIFQEISSSNNNETSNSSQKLTKVFIKSLINKKDKSIELIPVVKISAKVSKVWEDFNFIKYNSKKIPDMVYCLLCNDVFKYNKDSTRANIRHNEYCKSKTTTTTTTTTSSNKSTKKFVYTKLKKETQKQIDKLTALAAAKDCRPHSFARGEGFINLVQFYVDQASLHGKFEVKEYSPHASTVVSNLNELKITIKSKLIKLFNDIKNCCCILDHWSSYMNKIKFVGIAVK